MSAQKNKTTIELTHTHFHTAPTTTNWTNMYVQVYYTTSHKQSKVTNFALSAQIQTYSGD